MKRIVFLLVVILLAVAPLRAQRAATEYTAAFERVKMLQDKRHYVSAYQLADSIRRDAMAKVRPYVDSTLSRSLLTACHYMSDIAACYQEDAWDSAVVHYRAIMPYLTPVDRSLCYLFLHEDDSALADTAMMHGVKKGQVLEFCHREGGDGFEVTPTMYEVVMWYVVNKKQFGSSLGEALLGDMVRYYQSLEPTIYHVSLLLNAEATMLSRKAADTKARRTAIIDSAQRYINRYRDSKNKQLAKLYSIIASKLVYDSLCNEALAYCDSAITLFPKSEEREECEDLKRSILRPDITITLDDYQPADMDLLGTVRVRNVDTIYWRVINRIKTNSPYSNASRKQVESAKPVSQWCQALTVADDHRNSLHHFYIPALPTGEYMLIASYSPNLKADGYVVQTFLTTQINMVVMEDLSNGYGGYLTDRVTGKPIAGQQVSHQVSKRWGEAKFRTVATCKTDKQGYFFIDKVEAAKLEKDGYWGGECLMTQDKGMEVRFRIFNATTLEDTVRSSCLLLDRPVYKPGDTIRCLAVTGETYRQPVGKVCQGDTVEICLIDHNAGDIVDSVMVCTDEYGSATAQFVLANDIKPGNYGLHYGLYPSGLPQAYRIVRVEAYKQPKFLVTLQSAERKDDEGRTLAPCFGDSLTVDGLAASYSQVPIANARVRYAVTRSRTQPWWRNGGWYGSATTVCEDSLLTDVEGHFHIAFVPLPDSSIDLDTKPCFSYRVNVYVTDLNGETHEQSATYLVGYENSHVAIDLPAQTDDLSELTYRYYDLNRVPLQGKLELTIERLRQPQEPRLKVSRDSRHYMDTSTFRRHYPLYAYSSDETDPCRWSVAEVAYTTTVQAQEQPINKVSLPKLPAGVYRVKMRICSDKQMNRVSDAGYPNISQSEPFSEVYVNYTPRDCKQVQSCALVWSDINNDEVEVGDTLVLRVGSRFRDVTVFVNVGNRNNTVLSKPLFVDGNMVTISVPVTEAMLGGVSVSLCAVKAGHEERNTYWVVVPYTHKHLDVRFVTFRDRLTPGERETWTLKVQDSRQQPVAAQLAMTMYDASLNTYASLDDGFEPWRVNERCEMDFPTMMTQGWYGRYTCLVNPIPYPGRVSGISTPMFLSLDVTPFTYFAKRKRLGVSSSARGENGIDGIATMVSGVVQTKSANARVMREVEMVDVEDVEIEEEVLALNEVEVVDMSVIDNDAEIVAVAEVVNCSAKEPETEELYVRNRLGTLAFFEPTLRTDADGTISYSFQVPDLLTEWDIRGLAWTKDLCVGNMQRKLITQKQLMIQPNIPRFLREGDDAVLMAKVSNLTDSAMTVQVTFDFEIDGVDEVNEVDGVDGASKLQNFKTSKLQSLIVPPHSTEPVTFTVHVPVGGTVATYRFVADGGRHSDGEQGPLPLLTNRQAVTQSVSMYMNGAGSKSYTLVPPKSATAQPVSLTVEYTANPLWLAVQTLPYLSDKQNPSNLYLFNSYYVNSLGSAIAARYPELKHCADNASDADSRLMVNEEVSQTLLEETPWLREGRNEVERLRRIANYYDEKQLNKQIASAMEQLEKSQRPDGSWSWMPEGRYGSEYVTQYILQGLGQMFGYSDVQTFGDVKSRRPNISKKALAYIDREAYEDYLEQMKYLKKHPKNETYPINLDYLYTRSFYADEKLSPDHRKAYDYYYTNLKKKYDRYTDLYSQAVAALVLYRHGDKDLAGEMVTRIKEKALYNDEMGMYWRDNKSGWFSNERPVEVQALLIETFREVQPADTLSVGKMQQWLLKQKQTTSWNTDIATVRAIQALLPVEKTPLPIAHSQVSISSNAFSSTMESPQEGAGYVRKTYCADSVDLAGPFTAQVKQEGRCPSWGAVYYQYTEQMDKVPASETGITMMRKLFRLSPDGKETLLAANDELKVGDRLRIRLEVSVDRNMEYVQLKAFRAACLEPVSTRSGWRWNTGLSYYISVNNSHDAIYVDRLDKGKYVIDCDYYVTNPGTFTLAPSVLQCLYAPEFRSTSSGMSIKVTEQKE